MTGKQTWTLALAALLVCVPLSACGAKESPLPDAATYDTGDDSGWEKMCIRDSLPPCRRGALLRAGSRRV